MLSPFVPLSSRPVPVMRRPVSLRPRRFGEILIAAAALLLPLSGCGWFGGQGRSPVIAEISGKPVKIASFDEYVSQTLAGQPREDDEKPGPELLSRLLDRFLEEELIVREAERRGVTVSDDEIAEELKYLSEEEGGSDEKMNDPAAREAARRAVLLEKFREEQILANIKVSQDEIEAYYKENRDQFHQSSHVVLRQILLDDEAEAHRIRDELWLHPSNFQEVAEQKSLAPDGGQPAAYDEANLPPEVVDSISGVEEGQVSRVCKSPEGVRIFLVEKRQAAREVGVEEAADQIRLLLMQEKSRRAYDELLAKLRAQSGLVIHEENIPFKYVK